jgi:DNA-binding IclR family transcriptional regulator
MSDSGGVAAVERALSILDALTEDKVTLADLSKRTGLYKSTLLRLAKSLEKFGYVLRTDDGCYRVGAKALLLGSLYQRHFRTADIVPSILRKVVDELHEGASFYVAEGDRRVVLHRVEAARAVRDAVHEGDRFSLTHGAAGHVLRAFAGVRGERLDRIRESMYAASYGERDPETAAVAVPVFGAGNRLIGALNVSGPRYRIEALGEERIVPVLFAQAHALTKMFAGDPDAFAGWQLRGRAAAQAASSRRAPTRSRRTSKKR